MESLASCRSFDQGNVISWAESAKMWNTSHVELRNATGDDEDILSTPFAKNSPFCASHKVHKITRIWKWPCRPPSTRARDSSPSIAKCSHYLRFSKCLLLCGPSIPPIDGQIEHPNERVTWNCYLNLCKWMVVTGDHFLWAFLFYHQAWEKHLFVFPQRRTKEMAEYICRVHGGHLPVPSNIHENRVCAERIFF